MSRAERLLALLQILHHHRQPVSGAELARTLGVSQRTLYRDIASLQAQGAAIRGEPGVGYLLTPGFLLPPMMFSRGELEALLLGTRWVAAHTDHELADYAQCASSRPGANGDGSSGTSRSKDWYRPNCCRNAIRPGALNCASSGRRWEGTGFHLAISTHRPGLLNRGRLRGLVFSARRRACNA